MKRVILDGDFNSGSGINFDSGVLEIRSGAAPGPEAAEGGTLLASITLPADAFAAASGSAIAKAGTWQDASADGTGTAAHFRMRRSGDSGGASTTTSRLEGTVGTSGSDINLDSVSITAGQSVTITSFSFSL
jgi:hypothetical protein